MIREFFSNRYGSDRGLGELAEILHVSERQAERLVWECVGRSFRDELTATRMVVADQLLNTTDISLGELAQYLGYKSYAGFWKAYKKYKSKKNESEKGVLDHDSDK